MSKLQPLLLVVSLVFIFLTLTPQALDFLCTFRDKSWYVIPVHYTCDQARVSLLMNQSTLKSVRGVHMIGKSDVDVMALYVERDETKQQKLPKGIEVFFPDLLVLYWWYGSLTTITADDIRSFPNLKILDLHSNKISSLEDDLFQYTPNIIKISFTSNKINYVGQALLSNMNELNEAFFQNNVCISFGARTNQEVQELKQRLLSQCQPLNTSPLTVIATCDVRCTLNIEVDELAKRLKGQETVIKEQSKKFEERIFDLEKQVRDKF